MADPASAAPAPPPSSSPSGAKAGEPRYLVLLAITVLGTAMGAMLVALSFGALFTFVPALVGTIFGLLVGLGLPLFLALRAAAALRRRNRGLLMRRLVVLFLIGATQLALFGAILNWSSRTTGNVAWTAYEVLDVVGGLPILSDLLYAHAERNNAVPGTHVKGKPKGPTVGPDGGPLDVGTQDGGPAGTTADGGSAASGPDGGVAGLGTDVTPPAPAIAARGPAPPKPKAGIPLSPRTAGKAARTFAASATTSAGDNLVAVGTVSAGGALTWRIVDLAAHEKLGDPTLVEAAEDGHVAAILGGGQLVLSRPGKTTAEHVKQLAVGQKLTIAGAPAEIQAVRDVVIAPGGALLAIVSTLGGGGELVDSLVSIAKPGTNAAAAVIRAGGDKVPQSNDVTVAKTWSFKKGSGASSVLIAETYLEGGDDLTMRLSGDNWSVNPQRLLVVKVDAPKAQVELARTGQEPSGVEGYELQIFGDAWLLPDGRALFDANYLEKGADGWLFVAKQGGVFALASEKRESDTAPWSVAAPRARSLEAAADGTFVFRRADGAAVMASIDRPNDATAAILGADALSSEGKKIGNVMAVDVPSLVKSEWILASVQLRAMGGTATHDAIVLASKQDVQNGKCEVILEVGAAVPGQPAAPVAKPGAPPAPPPPPKTIQSIRYGKGRDELLWP